MRFTAHAEFARATATNASVLRDVHWDCTLRGMSRVLQRACSIALLVVASPLLAQRGDLTQCKAARDAENERHKDAMAELDKRAVDIDNESAKAMMACPNKADNGCRRDVGETRAQKYVKLNQDRSDENARSQKVFIDISRGACNANASPAKSSAPTAPPDAESPILATDDTKRLFKLGAEMNVLADELAPMVSGNAGVEFLKGLADWAGGTLDMLAQKPGVPLQQMAQSLVAYLTNDNAANHKALQQAAEQAVKEFEKNPARFLGQNVPNVLPGPGVLGKVPALRQLANVEKAAARIKTLTQARRAFAGTILTVLEENRSWGTGAGTNPCFAKNACFATAQAEAELFRVDGAFGNGVPTRINGVYAPMKDADFVQSSEQITKNLKRYGDGFAPRRTGSYNPEQLDQIWNGNPIRMNSTDDIRRLVEREGPGSQGLVFVQYKPTAAHVPGDPLGHVMNVQNRNSVGTFLDRTTPGKPPVLDPSRTRELWFYPIP